MGVADRDRERIGGIGARLDAGQQPADHHGDLALVGMARAGHRLLHEVRGVLEYRQTGACRRQHHHAARLAELESRPGIDVDESLFDRGLERLLRRDHGGGRLEQLGEALEKSLGQPLSAKLMWRPKTTAAVEGETAQTLLDMIAALDDNDDVQNVYANFELSDDALAKFAA